MGGIRLTGVVAALTVIAGAQAAAGATADATRGSDGYTYFNRPGAPAGDYEHDLGDCIARGVAAFPDGRLSKRGEVRTSNPALYGGIVAGLIANAAYQAKLNTNLQNCMTVAGWRVMRVDDAAGAALWARPPADIGRELAAWVGAVKPPGEAVRSYENDLARRGAVLYVIRPFPATGMKSLSLKAFDPGRLEPEASRDPERFAGEGSKFDAKPFKAGMEAASPAQAVVIFSWAGKPASKFESVTFRRFGPAPDLNAFAADGQPDEFQFGNHPTATVGDRKIYAVPLPPGRWRIMYRGGLELCLGAPSFEAKPGEVIYLGNFNYAAATFAPDMRLDPAGLPLAPALVAKARPAAWMNGARWPCHFLFNHFAMDFAGFPAEPGYSVRP